MAIREIVKEGDDCLRKVCRPVDKFDKRLAVLLDDMAQTMYEGNGVGLAAPQVGVLRRVVVIDCGEKLYYSVTNNYSREQAYFFCSNYRKSTANCTAHYTREKVVYALVLESLRRVLFYVQAFEKQFVQEQLDKSSGEQRKELTKKRRELAKSEKRIDELDILFQRIYEDNVSGKRSDECFATMSASYETEQKALKESLVQLKADIEMQNDKTANVSEFVDKVRCYTEIRELTPAIVNEFLKLFTRSGVLIRQRKSCLFPRRG